MRARSPRAVELLEKGEALAKAGAFEAAEAAFAQGANLDPDGSLLLRRDCEAWTALGRRVEAVNACTRALEGGRANASFRAMVRALVDGPESPTPQQLAEALLLTETERDQSTVGNPTAAAALCDIAASLGDGIMLQHCAEALDRMAPDDVEARRAHRILLAQCPPWRFWTGWFVLFASVVISVAHAIRRRMRSAPGRAVRVVTFGVVFWICLLTFAHGAFAAPATAGALAPAEEGYLSQWPVDDTHPEAHIPSEPQRNADPIQFGYWLQDVALKGEHASKRGDHLAAAKFYGVLAKIVPDRAIGYSKACDEFDAAGELEKATNECGAALLHEGLLVKDYLHYVRLVLAHPSPLTDAQSKTLGAVIAHMKEDPAGKDAVLEVECEVGVRTSNIAELEDCTQGLAARAPDDLETISYEWSLAMQQGKLDEAVKLVERAKALGLKAESVDSMVRATAMANNHLRSRILWGVIAAALFLAALGVAVWTAMTRRRAPAPA